MSTGKGQSAIEYLMSYGWMLLVVALIGGAVFSLVQGQAIESVSGFSGTEVNIDDFGMNSEDELMLSMRNTAADEVQIKAVELEDPETGATTKILSGKNIGVGNSQTVTVDGFERTSSSNKQNLRVIYGSGGIDDQVVEGTITGNLKAKNHVYLQNAVFNRSTDTLNITARNTGNTEATVDYTVNSDSNSFTGNLGTVSSGETTSFTVNTDETFPLQNVSLKVEGQHFSNSQKQLKCTPTKGLIGYWPFNREQTKNGYAVDLSGQQNKGSIDGDIETNQEGMVGGSYRLDEDGERIEVGDKEIYDFGFSSFSLIGWAKTSYTSDYQQIFSKRNSNRVGGGYGPGYIFRPVRINNGELEFQMDDGEGRWLHVESDGPNWADGSWHLYSMSAEKDNQAKLFVDDTLIDTANEDVGNVSNSQPLFLGSNGGGRTWNGSIDEFRIYNRSLSQQEIQRLYNVRSEDWAVSSCKLTN